MLFRPFDNDMKRMMKKTRERGWEMKLSDKERDKRTIEGFR